MELFIILFIFVLSVCWLLLLYNRKFARDVTGRGEENALPAPVEFLKTAPIEVIEKELISRLRRTTACAQMLGQGYTSAVYLPPIPQVYDTPAGKIRVAIKEVKQNNNSILSIKIIDSVLYIAGAMDLTPETLILMLLADISNQTNLPRLLDYSMCAGDHVSRLVIPMYGLAEPITIDLRQRVFPEAIFWKQQPRDVITNRLATLVELFAYMYYVGDGVVAKLPNGYECDIVAYYDSVCRDYLKTHAILVAHSIYPFDMHPANIFLMWPEKGAPVPVLGDVGNWMAHPRKDIIIIGGTDNVELVAKYAAARMDARYTTMDFIYKSFTLLTPAQAVRSRAAKIFNDPPYNAYPLKNFHLADPLVEFIKANKTTEELLRYFDN